MQGWGRHVELAFCGPRKLIISRTMKEEGDRMILHKVLVIYLIFVQNSIVYFAKPYFYFFVSIMQA